jgi:hypothetical protein
MAAKAHIAAAANKTSELIHYLPLGLIREAQSGALTAD